MVKHLSLLIFSPLYEKQNMLLQKLLLFRYQMEVKRLMLGFTRTFCRNYPRKKDVHCHLPVYHTVSSGPPHLPIFVCIVEIEGETFSGTPAKSKKQAENFAAKVAWCYHEERKLSRMSATSSQDQESNGFSCLLQSAVTGDLCKCGSLIVNSIQSNSPIISSKDKVDDTMGASSRVSGNLSTLLQTQAALEKESVAPSVHSESLQNHKPIGNSSATQTIKSLSVN